VLNTGGPAVMPWISQVASVVEMWYPGEEDGNAAAAILFGDVDPSGKLPITFPVSLSQTPIQSAQQYPGVDGTAVYSEGLLVGYRWYEAEGITPLFPFGFGLSYTTFKMSDFSLSPAGSGYSVHLTLTNTETTAGADVAQVYLADPPSTGEPPQSLTAYQRVFLAPGQSVPVDLDLAAPAFSYWDTGAQSWETAAGCYQLRLGDSSVDLPFSAEISKGGATC